MSERKYIFKIDNSKAAEKHLRNWITHGKEKITSSNFKVTCVNCLYYKETEFAENYKDYNSLPQALALLTPNYDIYFTIAKSHKCGDEVVYLSDKDGNTTGNVRYNNDWITNIIKDFKDLYDAVSNCDILLLENLTDTYIQNIIEYLTGNQLQALVEHLTDDQLQALVDHLTNHQLKTLAQELNETKLKIIVPILNEDQLGALVKGLNPGQLENVLPHLKMDQFKVLINSTDDPQLIDLTRNLSDHHLTILSKELWHERLPILVHTLEEDKLKDLINKLDNFKFEVVVQNLIDPSRIKVVINSLTDEKPQILARNMPEQQFAKLLNELSPEELKDIIHKLPYEKVISVADQSGDKNQFYAVIKAFQEKFREQAEQCDKQMAKQDEMMKILKELENKGKGSDDFDWNNNPYLRFQDAELTETEEYIQVEHGITLV